ncbi:MAG: pyruvate kinase [Planctomycetota bacterium]
MAARSASRSKRRRWQTRTKIVATIGPASSKASRIRDLIRAGVDVFRLNFSHGTHTEHAKVIRRVRRAARAESRAVGILADLQGPKIRVGELAGGEPVLLKRSERLTIVADEEFVGGPGRIGCSYLDLPKDVRKGERVLLDDGNIELRVEKIEGNEVLARVRHGGLLRQHKGINLPGSRINAPSLSEKDLFDLEFALTNGVDFVALSFVRRAEEVKKLQRLIARFGADAEVIAKIERPEAVKAIHAITAVADGIMIARGDMGVEIGADEVPLIQKDIIGLCIEGAKPVITATQMLESMVDHPRPTRAEASDVANAVFDRTSALMLSAESAAGKHPILAVRTMDRIVRRVESDLYKHATVARRIDRHGKGVALPISEATVHAAARAALESGARALVVFSESGRTARLVASQHLPTPLFALTPSARTYARLSLLWGILPVLTPRARNFDRMLRVASEQLLAMRYVRRGDRVVFIAGSVQVSGATNTVQICEIGG